MDCRSLVGSNGDKLLHLFHGKQKQPAVGFEPTTLRLRSECNDRYATPAAGDRVRTGDPLLTKQMQ